MEELPKPRISPSMETLLASLGPITTFGRKIRYFRIKNGMKQAELAKKLGVGKTAVSQWEQGHTRPRKRRLKPINTVLGASF